jgi:hypothetical protein
MISAPRASEPASRRIALVAYRQRKQPVLKLPVGINSTSNYNRPFVDRPHPAVPAVFSAASLAAFPFHIHSCRPEVHVQKCLQPPAGQG